MRTTLVLVLTAALPSAAVRAADPSRDDVVAAMRKAAGYYHDVVAVRGGYVYYTSLDLKVRHGEGVASPDQVWVQPPGTPTVGLAYLAAYRGTGDRWHLDAATDAARALVYGQLKSGGWTNAIDFDPRGARSAAYRNGQGRGKDNSSLDDGITQGALALLMRVDEALDFKDAPIHEAAKFGLDALLAAQFANGGFPQVWTGPADPRPVVKAAYPQYDWRTENRIKAYWTQYTLNDDLAGDVAETLIVAHEVYRDERALAALRRLGDFLLLAQMPEPQPAWAQQYDAAMRPIWARKFEPPAITGRESQDAIGALMTVHSKTGDAKYLAPIPRALDYLAKSTLPDGRLARYYELKTNRPLYMTSKYELTYDDADVPSHYGWKVSSHLDRLRAEHDRLAAGRPAPSSNGRPSAKQVSAILAALDESGRWVSEPDGSPLVGQPKFRQGERYLSSEVFSRNLTTLSRYVAK